MPDERIRAAIANWSPRMVTQGVDHNDFGRVTSGLERWEEWLPAWRENGDMHSGLAREAEEHGQSLTAGEAWVRAALSYHFAKFLWLVDLDQYREVADLSVQAIRSAHGHLDPTAERIEIPFDQATMVANLRRPRVEGLPPLVILLPGLDSTKEEFFNWEGVFLARGMSTVSLDGPGQGETGYNTHIRPDYEVPVAALLDGLEGRADLDLGHVGVAGVSLGGYYAPRAAAFEPRIRAAVSIAGPYNWGECWPQLPSLSREAFRHHAGAADEAEAEKYAHRLDLQDVLPKLEQPLLVASGKADRLIPWQHAERMAAEAPNAELAMYPEGNHVCNNIPYKYRPLVADWLAEHLDALGVR